jgi:hypothetical protein
MRAAAQSLPSRPERSLLPALIVILAFAIAQPATARAQTAQLHAPQLDTHSLPDPAPASPMAAITGAAPSVPSGPLNLRERFIFGAHASFGPTAFIIPALGAGFAMVDPPSHYPRDWKDGAPAFGRNYGAQFGTDGVAALTRFATAAIDREDPRYYPSSLSNPLHRVAHAIAFSIIDRNSSGHRTLALSNFTGAASGGFVGMAWEPDGFNDPTHALQRGEIQFATFAGHNLLLEFAPELGNGLHKLHLFRPKDSNTP